jgi:hypothetical protein
MEIRHHATFSRFCSSDDEVVYWKRSFSSGRAMRKASWAANAPSWKPDRISLSLPGYQLMSPMAKIPGVEVWNFSVSTLICLPSSRSSDQSAMGPSSMLRPKKVSRSCS